MLKTAIIKKLPDGKYRLYGRKKDRNGKRKNLGTYDSLSAVKKRERQIQFFKHHADDGLADDQSTKTLGRLSNMAAYLEEAGFIDSADKVYAVMNAIDGSLEDCAIDADTILDRQMNLEGGLGFVGMSPGQKAPSFSMDVAASVVGIANKLDTYGLYAEADILDAILVRLADEQSDFLNIIEELEEQEQNKPKEDEEGNKQNEEVAARNNGRSISEMLDNTGSGMSQGLSDYYMYQPSGSLERNL